MAAQKYFVVLEESEVTRLETMLRRGTQNARVLTRARVLLMTNEAKGKGKIDKDICDALHITRDTTQSLRRRYVEEGIDRALFDAPRPGQPKRFTPQHEAMVVAIACTNPPDGYGSWTIDLIREETIKRIGKSIGRNTVDKILLKNDCKPWLKKNVVYSRHYPRI